MTTKKIKKKCIYIYKKRREFPHCVNVENEMTARGGRRQEGKERVAEGVATLLLLGLPLLKHLSTKRLQFNNFHSAHRWLFIVLDFIYYLFVCLG